MTGNFENDGSRRVGARSKTVRGHVDETHVPCRSGSVRRRTTALRRDVRDFDESMMKFISAYRGQGQAAECELSNYAYEANPLVQGNRKDRSRKLGSLPEDRLHQMMCREARNVDSAVGKIGTKVQNKSATPLEKCEGDAWDVLADVALWEDQPMTLFGEGDGHLVHQDVPLSCCPSHAQVPSSTPESGVRRNQRASVLARSMYSANCDHPVPSSMQLQRGRDTTTHNKQDRELQLFNVHGARPLRPYHRPKVQKHLTSTSDTGWHVHSSDTFPSMAIRPVQVVDDTSAHGTLHEDPPLLMIHGASMGTAGQVFVSTDGNRPRNVKTTEAHDFELVYRSNATCCDDRPAAANRTRHSNANSVSHELIKQYFIYPITEAAAKLKVCPTVLKKRCRKYGIKRWPYRKLISLNNKISKFEEIMRSPTLSANVVSEISRKYVQQYLTYISTQHSHHWASLGGLTFCLPNLAWKF
eukprot:scaffold2727_cov385-Prasinococcus_capsulatus_cf.AAC.14